MSGVAAYGPVESGPPGLFGRIRGVASTNLFRLLGRRLAGPLGLFALAQLLVLAPAQLSCLFVCQRELPYRDGFDCTSSRSDGRRMRLQIGVFP